MNSVYRQVLSDSSMRKKFNKFSDLINYVVDEYG